MEGDSHNLGRLLGNRERETVLRQSSSSEINLTNLEYSVFTGERENHTASLAQVSYMRVPSPQSSREKQRVSPQPSFSPSLGAKRWNK